jgi:hypothetical protein
VPVETIVDELQEFNWQRVRGIRWKKTDDDFGRDTWGFQVAALSITLEATRNLSLLVLFGFVWVCLKLRTIWISITNLFESFCHFNHHLNYVV